MTIVDQIAKVAETIRHCGDYGECFWNEKTKTVLWVGGDSDFQGDFGYSDLEGLKQALFSIDGVEHFELACEELPYNEDSGALKNGYIEVEYSQRPNNLFLYEWEKNNYKRRGREMPVYIHEIWCKALGIKVPEDPNLGI